MEQPDITPTEARNAALSAAFKGLDAILSGQFELPSYGVGVTEEGIFLNLTKIEYCCGDRETIEESVFFAWSELTDLSGSKLADLAETRWAEAGAARVAAARAEQERKELEARQRADKAAEEARQKKNEIERAELRRLMAAYPTEVSAALSTNLPTTAP